MNGTMFIVTRLDLKQNIYGSRNKKSGPYNAHILWLIANRWKEAPEAHCRIYPPVCKLTERNSFVKFLLIHRESL